MVTIADIQQVFDESGIDYIDQHGAPLAAIVEQLSDGIFVGYYADVNVEWVDAEKLGNTPEDALQRAKVLTASN